MDVDSEDFRHGADAGERAGTRGAGWARDGRGMGAGRKRCGVVGSSGRPFGLVGAGSGWIRVCWDGGK